MWTRLDFCPRLSMRVLVLRQWQFWLFEFVVLSLINQLWGLTVNWFTDIQNFSRIVSFGSKKDICSLNLDRSSTSPSSHGIFDGDAGLAQCWEHSPLTNVAWVRFPDPASTVGWFCWFSALHREVFSAYFVFPSSQKAAFYSTCVKR